MDNLLALPIGTELAGDYRIRQVLGAGGFGITYLAEEVPLNREVAIKEYFPSDFAARSASLSVRSKSGASEEDYRWGLDRFIEEAKTLAKFHHPNITRVYRYFQANNTAYMVLQLESGQSFKAWLDKLGRPPRQAELDAILHPILEALELIHSQDFLHRDIAPDNIIIRADGAPVLIDFGSARGEIARHSRTVSALVKPGYSPFEQYGQTGKQQGPWTDIYALAATLYHAVTGGRPADAPTRISADELVPAARAAKARYRPGFLAAIDRALRLKVEERPQSIAAWRAELLAAEPEGAAIIPFAPAPQGSLARTRKIEDAAVPVLRWPARRKQQGGAAVAAQAAAEAEEPSSSKLRMRKRVKDGQGRAANDASPAAGTPLAAAASPKPKAGEPGKLVNGARRRLMSLLSGVRATEVTGADVAVRSPPAVKPAVPAAAPEAASSETTRIERKAEPGPPAARPARTPRPPRPARKPLSPGFKRALRGMLVRLAVIVALVSGMVYAQDWMGYFDTGSRARTVSAVTDLSLIRTLRGHESAVLAIGVTTGARPSLVSLSADGIIKQWDATTGAIVKSLPVPGEQIDALAVDGDTLALARSDGSVEAWTLTTGERLGIYKLHDGAALAVLLTGEKDRIISGGQDRRIRFATTARGGRSRLTGHDGAVASLAFAPERDYLVSGGSDRVVKLWDARRQRLLKTFDGHADDVGAVAISRDGNLVASGGYDKRAKLWSTQSGRLTFTLEGHGGRVTAVAFSPSGRLLATASEDGTVKLWDTGTGALLHTYVGHSSAVRAVTFLPEGHALASAGDDATVRLWNARIAGYP